LRANPASTVAVVNLVFSTACLPVPLHPPGFGYLIPRPEGGYEGSGAGMLGVVFDTASLAAQDTVLAGKDVFVKITAMMGGPYTLAPEQTAPETVRTRIGEQLQYPGGILPPPAYYKVHRNVECIPTYTVGHVERMEELREALREQWAGKLSVAGAGVSGVSMPDCVKAGRDAARTLVRQGGLSL